MGGVAIAQSALGPIASSAAGTTTSTALRATVAPVATSGSRLDARRSSAYRSGISASNATRPATVSKVSLPVPGCPEVVEPGTFANGEIPLADLCPIPGTSGEMLRSDAAAAMEHLQTAYAAQLGVPICITDSYRSLRAQKRLFKRKPELAAVPGTSNHGLGIAVDLCGGVDRVDSATHAWMMANGPRFGWTNPAWAQAGGSRPEPWHWEYAAPGGAGDS